MRIHRLANSRLTWGAALIAGLIMGATVFSQDAEAHQVKRVIRGSASFVSTAEIASVDLSGQLGGDPLDLNKSFLIFTIRTGDNQRGEVNIMGTIDSQTTAQFVRFRVNSALDLEYMIVEFVSGVTVISGATTLSNDTLTKVITISQDVDLAKSFSIISYKSYKYNENSNTDERDVIAGMLSDTDQLTVTKIEVGTSTGDRSRSSMWTARAAQEVLHEYVARPQEQRRTIGLESALGPLGGQS